MTARKAIAAAFVRISGAAITFALAQSLAAAAPPDLFDPVTGYRTSRYQAAVPDLPPAGQRVWIDDIDRLVREDRAVLLDVSPIHGAGYDKHTGVWLLSKPHETLPGATWLPEVGRGDVEPLIERYFAHHLARLTEGDKARPVIIFCHADCWMSWNAMKRAAAFGYTALKWFPEGTDGWRDFDRTLVPASPAPVDLGANAQEISK